MRLLGVVRVEADRHQDVTFTVRGALAEVDDAVVPGIEELHAQVALQRRLLATDAVELGDLGDDVAGLAEVPRADLVLLRVEPMVASAARMRKPGTTGVVQEERVDVRRVDEEVRPVAQRPGRLVEGLEVLLDFRLGVAPGEVGVTLAVADLAQPGHHRRLGKGFGEEHHFRVAAADIGDQPLPERQRLGVRVVDAELGDALVDPALHHVAQGQPQRRHRIGGVEVDVDDVLVLLRRVFRIADAAVRAPGEPARMFLQPGVVLRALDGEVEGDLQAMLGGGGHQAAEVLAATQLRVDRVVAAVRAADGVGAAGIVRPGLQGIVAALAELAADGVDRREIEDVEAHVADHRQACVNIVEGAVAAGIVGDRARKQLVPAGERGALALHVEGEFRAATEVAAGVGLGHQRPGILGQQQLHLGRRRQALAQALDQSRQMITEGVAAALGTVLQVQAPFFQLQGDVHPGGEFLFQVVAIGGVGVDPGFDQEQVAAHFADAEPGVPAIVAQQAHRLAVPEPAAGLAPVEGNSQDIMAIGVHLATDRHGLAHFGLHRIQPGVDHRLGVLDHNARQQQRLGQAQRRVGGVVASGHALGFERLVAGHRSSLRYDVAVRIESNGRRGGSIKNERSRSAGSPTQVCLVEREETPDEHPYPGRNTRSEYRRPEPATTGAPGRTRRRAGQADGAAHGGRPAERGAAGERGRVQFLRSALFQFLDTDLAHPELLDLARHRHREFLDEAEMPRGLEVRDAVLAPGLQFLRRRTVPRVELDPGDDLLAIAIARDADHLHVGHRRVSEEELLQLPRIDVLAPADDHVLVAPGNAHVAVLVHARQVAGVHPARRVDGFGGRRRVAPVAEHHAVATGAQLADLPAGNHVALLVDDLAFQLRLGAPDTGHPQFELVVGAGLHRHRAGLGHAVGDLHFAHVQLIDDPAHHFDRAGGPGHDPRAQAGQVVVGALRLVEHGDEHGRHAVQRCGALLDHGLQGQRRVEGVVGVDHGAAVGHAAQVAHDHAEAVVQRHRDHQTVVLGQAQAFADHVAVVEDVVVTEGRALGEAGGAGGVLDVHRLVELQALLAGIEVGHADPLRVLRQAIPGEEAGRRLGGQADDPAQVRQALATELPRRLVGDLRQQLGDHPVVVRTLERPGAHEPLAAGLLQGIFQLAAAIGRVDVDQDDPGLGAGELGDAPLRAVRRPDAEAVASLQAQGHEGTGMQVDGGGEFGPGVAQLLMADYQRLAPGEARCRAVEGLADGHGQQGLVLAALGVARLSHGDPCLCLFLGADRGGLTLA
ncbi:hypothetical protein L1887_57425 [Cichorium endivia]|nr:hypothetical protein L1887_57425 [Cichorium endivia]